MEAGLSSADAVLASEHIGSLDVEPDLGVGDHPDGGASQVDRWASIGRLKRVPLRAVWPHEAIDFTGWLADNTDVLQELIGIELTEVRREQSAGSFNVDIVAQDRDGHTVVIENQLEKTNHDHLGKLITYLAAFGATTAIWIVSEPRAEHVRAVSWLNESRNTSFYLLKVEAVVIDESRAAPQLTVIVAPSEEERTVGDTKREIAQQHSERRLFWIDLLKVVRQKTTLHANLSPSDDSWIATSAGKAGIYSYVVGQHNGRIELYIDRGDEAYNLSVFRQLEAHKISIEAAFGESLDWQELPGRRACRISKTFTAGGYKDRGKWSQLHNDMVDGMIRLEKALRPHVGQL